MSQPCEQAPTIQRVEAKIDKISDALSVLAVQQRAIDDLEDGWEDHEDRIRVLESAPAKHLVKISYVIGGAIVSGVIALLIAFSSHQ